MVDGAATSSISSPAARTPMNSDVEHASCSRCGTKNVHVAAFDGDPSILQRERSRYINGEECDFAAMKAVADNFRIEAGLGVYLPSYVPHWVETEAGVSISFSIPFFTAFCRRAETVYRINRRMRKLHLSPRPPGASQPIYCTKEAVFRSWSILRDRELLEVAPGPRRRR